MSVKELHTDIFWLFILELVINYLMCMDYE